MGLVGGMGRDRGDSEWDVGVVALEGEGPALVFLPCPRRTHVHAEASDFVDEIADGVGDFPRPPEDGGESTGGGGEREGEVAVGRDGHGLIFVG